MSFRLFWRLYTVSRTCTICSWYTVYQLIYKLIYRSSCPLHLFTSELQYTLIRNATAAKTVNIWFCCFLYYSCTVGVEFFVAAAYNHNFLGAVADAWSQLSLILAGGSSSFNQWPQTTSPSIVSMFVTTNIASVRIVVVNRKLLHHWL